MPATSMVDRIVRYVLSMQDQLSRVRLEEIAVCAALGSSTTYSRQLAQLVMQWQSAPHDERPHTCGQRQQLLLRTVIDLLLSRGADGLSWDEAACLCETFDLGAHHQPHGERLRSLLEPHIQSLRVRRERTSQSSGLSMLETRCRIIFPDQLMQSPRRQTTLFPGQPRPPQGPALELAGPVRLIGAIPDDCTLVVTSGPCSVDGYVLGCLAAAGGCDISENIAGSVVASSGSVRCRNIIEKAFVVAKAGSVRFVQAMHPRLVFAGRRITASDSISRGLFYGADIESTGIVRGGTFHVTGRMTAARFTPEDAFPLNVVLRTSISFEEYGELLGPEALHLRARAAALRRKLVHLGNAVRATQADAEHAASTIVLRAFSDLRLMNVLEDRGRTARRVAILNRLIGALQELYAGAEEALAKNEQIPDELTAGTAFTDIEQDLDELSQEAPAEAEAAPEHDQVRALYERLGWTRNDRSAMLGVLGQLRDQMETWIVERQKLNAQLERLNREINSAVPEAGLEVLAQTAESSREPKLAALQRKIITLKNSPPSPEVQRKLQAPLVQIMFNMMQRRIQRLNELSATIKACKAELSDVNRELQAKYRLGETITETLPATVSGTFASGVRIYHDAYLIDAHNPPAGAVLKTPDSGDDVVTYQRGLASVFAQMPTAP